MVVVAQRAHRVDDHARALGRDSQAVQEDLIGERRRLEQELALCGATRDQIRRSGDHLTRQTHVPLAWQLACRR